VRITAALQTSYLYRGQSNSSWSLLPSLARLCKELAYDEAQAISVERRALSYFRSRAHLHGTNFSGQDLIGWWAQMQHHRAPTRILDWSSSPLVALYFAVNENWDHHGAVWSFHLQTFMQRAYPKDKVDEIDWGVRVESEKFFWSPCQRPYLLHAEQSKLSERMAAQQGSSTVSQHVLSDHATELENIIPEFEDLEGNQKSVLRTKWIIDKSAKRELLKRLHAMNVTAATLFPGIDGLGNELVELVRLSKTG
jgi:hypothetical protein